MAERRKNGIGEKNELLSVMWWAIIRNTNALNKQSELVNQIGQCYCYLVPFSTTITQTHLHTHALLKYTHVHIHAHVKCTCRVHSILMYLPHINTDGVNAINIQTDITLFHSQS